jgi:hypothetical protein
MIHRHHFNFFSYRMDIMHTGLYIGFLIVKYGSFDSANKRIHLFIKRCKPECFIHSLTKEVILRSYDVNTIHY